MTADNEAMPAELSELLAALREGVLDRAGAARLDVLVRGNADARRAYVEYQHMVADLRWLCGDRPSTELAPVGLLDALDEPHAAVRAAPYLKQPDRVAAPNLPGDAEPIGNAVKGGGLGRLAQGMPWIDAAPVIIFGSLMLAVGVLLGMRLGEPDRAQSASSSSPVTSEEAKPATDSGIARVAIQDAHRTAAQEVTIATLAETSQCRWEPGSLPTQAGARLGRGTLRLDSGLARIAFDSGAEVVLEGPAVFDVETERSGRLSIGQLVARATADAHGFTIQTPSATVVDLGTEFGVIAEAQGATEVHVFEGAVDVGPLQPESGSTGEVNSPRTRIVAGQARRLEAPPEGDSAAAVWLERAADDRRFARHVAPPEEEVLGDLLLADDFAAERLDRDRWRVITEGVPSNEASIRVADGRLELANRAHLVTRDQIDPRECKGLRIRGRWTFASDVDMLQILTRSDGVPSPSAKGDTQNGVEFIAATEHGGAIGIYGRGDAELQHAMALVPIQVGDTFDFEIVDDGRQVTFTVTEVGGEGATATVTTTCDVDLPTNFVVFHNRERGRQSRRAFLDDVTIEGHLRPNPAMKTAGAAEAERATDANDGATP